MPGKSTHSCCLELLGPFRLIQGNHILPRLPRQKAAHLLAYLALHPQRSHPREQLIDLLWPGTEIEAGRDSLNTTVSTLRKVLDPSGALHRHMLLADRHTIGLSSDHVTTDCAEFDHRLDSAKRIANVAERASLREQAIALYRGELLEGWYEEWVFTARTIYQHRYRQTLIDWAQDLEILHDWEGAQRAAQRTLEIDFLSEAAVLISMRVLARQGRTAAAIATFRRLEQQLRVEMNAEPARELRELADRLVHNPEALNAPAAASKQEESSIIVPGAGVPSSASISFAIPPPSNLPEWLTSFIGRATEKREIQRLLAQSRLLTLTGMGGCGKTRLAIEVGKQVQARYRDGVWLVELAALSDPLRLASTVAQALQVPEQAGQPMMQTLLRYLKDRQLLLILDNCEHLVGACAQLAMRLLTSCAGLRLLTTSREPLIISGEQTYRVPAMALPAASQDVSLSTLTEFSAIVLFLDRARLVKSDFTVTEAQAPVLAQICRRLEGIPLAIELAAARVRLLPLEELNRRLDHRLQLLSGGSRMALPRQQTLRGLIDWSYDLLNTPERLLFARLSVFADGWTLGAATAVCGAGEVLDLLDLLVSLVDKSLVMAEEANGAARYRMLETLREYAAEKLRQLGETGRLSGRHASYYADLAHTVAPHLKGVEMKTWLLRLDEEQANLRAALTWYLQQETGGEMGLQLCNDLYEFWRIRGHWAEGRARLRAARAHPGAQQPTLARAAATGNEGALEFDQGNYAVARSLYNEALAIYRAHEDRIGIADTLYRLGFILYKRRDTVGARAFYEERLKILKELEDQWQFAQGLRSLSDLALREGNSAEARALLEQCLEITRGQQKPEQTAVVYTCLGNVAIIQGDDEQAEAFYQKSLTLCRELDMRQGIANTLNNLATLAIIQNAPTRARPLLEESLVICRELNYRSILAAVLSSLGRLAVEGGDMPAACTYWQESLAIQWELEMPGTTQLMHLAHAAFLRGNWERAVQRYGTVETYAESDTLPHWPSMHRRIEAEWEELKAHLGGDVFQTAFNRGASQDVASALTAALEEEGCSVTSSNASSSQKI